MTFSNIAPQTPFPINLYLGRSICLLVISRAGHQNVCFDAVGGGSRG